MAGALAGASAVLVADYGRGVTSEPGVRSALAHLPARLPVVWDPHPRGAEPVPGARLATPNLAVSVMLSLPPPTVQVAVPSGVIGASTLKSVLL